MGRGRCDFLHPLGDVSGKISMWRGEVASHIEHKYLLSGSRDVGDISIESESAIDNGTASLREISRILSLIYDEQESNTDKARPPRLDKQAARVLVRLRPYGELGLGDITGDLFPPDVRASLCLRLPLHGQRICFEKSPACNGCEIRNFCSTYRQSEAARVARPKPPTVVDLFSGAGGLSDGFCSAGFRVILALDLNPVALRTYWLNHPAVPENRIFCRDIRKLRAGDLRRFAGCEQVDVLVGSPPCQGFSHMGFRSQKSRTGYQVCSDERNYLFEYMVSAAKELKPRLFVMENVPGMHSARREDLSFIELAASMLESTGDYKTAIWRLNASAFGVPQNRIRYFLVASRLGMLPCRPDEEYQDARRRDFDVDALPPITFSEAVFDLPPLKAGSGDAIERWHKNENASDPQYRRYLGKFGLIQDSPLIYNHVARPNNARDLELYSTLRPGENSIHAIETHGRGDLMCYRRDVFDDKYARLRGDRPCRTIVSHLAKDGNGYIHPSQTRSITVREAARIQSFHDRYIFCGSVSQQWIQLGNAVPPLLARAVAESFMQILRKFRHE